jgi:hypothetical protein
MKRVCGQLETVALEALSDHVGQLVSVVGRWSVASCRRFAGDAKLEAQRALEVRVGSTVISKLTSMMSHLY